MDPNALADSLNALSPASPSRSPGGKPPPRPKAGPNRPPPPRPAPPAAVTPAGNFQTSGPVDLSLPVYGYQSDLPYLIYLIFSLKSSRIEIFLHPFGSMVRVYLDRILNLASL